MVRLTGIYMIQSEKKPNRYYIGSALNFNTRWRLHLSSLRSNSHTNKKLQYHYNKYGEKDLIFSKLICCDPCDLLKQEQFFLDSYTPYFNILKIAGNVLGFKHSKETIRRLSIAKKGIPLSEEHKHKIKEANTGKVQSKETIIKRVQSLTGRRHSSQTKKKISDKKRGHTVSPETREKISKANTGRRHTQEYKDEMRILMRKRTSPMKGKKQTKKWQIAIQKSHTEESRRKQAESLKLYYLKKNKIA